MVCRSRDPNAQAKIDLPLRTDIQINRGENLLLLLGDCIESGERANRAVIFQAPGDLTGEVVAEFEIWRKDDALMYALAMERAVERRVQ